MRRLILLFLLPVFLAACGAENVWDSDEAVSRATYRDPGPSTITLITVRSNLSKEGAHAGLMIGGSQRVMFDPAGSFKHPRAPERGDVLYGFTPGMFDVYIDYHSRVTHHSVIQTVEVPPEVAERALQLVQAHGPAARGFCSNSISSILRQLPGFETVPHSFFPNRIMRGFAKLPGVTERTVFQDDDADNSGVLAAAAEAAATRTTEILTQ